MRESVFSELEKETLLKSFTVKNGAQKCCHLSKFMQLLFAQAIVTLGQKSIFTFIPSIHKYSMSTDYDPCGRVGTRGETAFDLTILSLRDTVRGGKLPPGYTEVNNAPGRGELKICNRNMISEDYVFKEPSF